MTNHTPSLTDHDVLLHARTRLQAHLPLHADGAVCTTTDFAGPARCRRQPRHACGHLCGLAWHTRP